MNGLEKLIVTEKNARAFGFDWPNINMVIEAAISECHEINDAILKKESPQRLQEEIGDLLHAAISICIFAGFDVNETLLKVNQKFANRMAIVEKLTQEKGLNNLHGQSIEFMLKLWDKAKKQAKLP